MNEFAPKYLNHPYEVADTKDLDAVLWELESVNIRTHVLDVSLEFWSRLQCSRYILLKSNGDIFYKYLKVNVNPKQEVDFLLY